MNEGLVALEPKPNHRRAPLVGLTEAGQKSFDASMRLQIPWINALADGLPAGDIETMHRVIGALCGQPDLDQEVLPEQGPASD